MYVAVVCCAVACGVVPQGILHFQHLTRKMMYRLIAEALEEEGITNVQPKDYLHFFCLGKREPMTPVRHMAGGCGCCCSWLAGTHIATCQHTTA
jgi:hypothetical protein